MEQKKLFLLDAYALIFRAYHAMKYSPRFTSGGMNTSAIFGFVNTLEEVLRKENPTHIAVCFDPAGKTFRHEMFADYKAGREATPEDIKVAVPYIKDIIRAYGIPVVEKEGYEVECFGDGESLLDAFQKKAPDLCILDIMMPGMDGLEMCRKIRETNNIPIIMLSARSADLDKILGLGTGADDYVTKPFNPLELTARVKSQLRRYTQLNPQSGAGNQVKNEISIKGLTINKDNHKVTVYGEEIKLTPIEFDILYLLASNPGRVFSTDEIFEKVWNEKVYEANNTVMVHIRRLRGKMKEDTRQNKIITTVWGVGYKIEK